MLSPESHDHRTPFPASGPDGMRTRTFRLAPMSAQIRVGPQELRVSWPLKRRTIPRSDVASARVIDRAALRDEIGWGLRVGAGGLWGGFGWLWTERRGIVQLYVSRLDRFVWLERRSGRPWLITPEQPEAFVRTLG